VHFHMIFTHVGDANHLEVLRTFWQYICIFAYFNRYFNQFPSYFGKGHLGCELCFSVFSHDIHTW